jgi:hypothetical protein
LATLLVLGLFFVIWRPQETPAPAERSLLPPGIPAAPKASAKDSSAKMKELLGELARETDRRPHDYWNHALLEPLRARMNQATNVYERMYFMFELAQESLNANELEQSVELFEEFFKLQQKHDPNYSKADLADLQMNLAVARLRQGEQANCIAHHNPASCLFPIANEGVHANPEGARLAMELLEMVLKEKPEDLQARWLLTVAAMAKGGPPSDEARQWLLPEDLFASDYDIKRFTDIAADAGLAVNGLAGGAALDDFDNDGDLDLMTSAWGQKDQLRYFTNDGKGHFTERTEAAGLTGLLGGLNIFQADYNNDGHTDLFVVRGAWLDAAGRHPNSLIRNNGDGTFTDATFDAGMLSFNPSSSAAWLDFNNDGWLDLFVVNETLDAKAAARPCELFKNQGDGTFKNVAATCGIGVVGYFKGVTAGDYDNDGWIDIFLSDYYGKNRLFHNRGNQTAQSAPRFQDVAAQAGVTEPEHSFPCWFWDYDNDGWLDLFVADYDPDNREDIVRGYLDQPLKGQGARLYRNLGNGAFQNVTQPAGLEIATLAMGVNFGDLDNDGFLDFYLGNGTPDFGDIFPNRMFRNAGGKSFQDVTTSGGFGHLQKGHGVAFGDIDNDGDQDVYAVMGGAYTGDRFFNALFANPGHGNRWIKLQLVGQTSNRSAIGARLKLIVDADGNERAIHRVVGSGGSFGSNPLTQEIGLGAADSVKRLEVSWPTSGEKQTFENLKPNERYTLVEGSKALSASAPTEALNR